ncbi:BlaI/MecI/CopY family transcriptional regulator [Robbsia sp. Bb-Pol-6]|uniref:BlaI/MecI/CopY family transcriptional regulator n=1 Tax=Robbsia betulipollinis TaxID=2981849 RepID=A0ABT3ZTS6_9BURK|nr:BlaI/MecI/CopY family transcriptional regulator [Robbsia betulipollinis]MCY0389966.1 BlaI/MecI/CopY family transcriptional regulator [Robbsia betulipollinis]
MNISLTDREADVMKILWERGPSVVSEVRAALADELAYTTVLTILRILENKGYVTHVDEGRGHRYTAAVQQHAARKSALQHLASKLFSGSTQLLFAHLVTDKKLTPKEIRHMRELLKQQTDEE